MCITMRIVFEKNILLKDETASSHWVCITMAQNFTNHTLANGVQNNRLESHLYWSLYSCMINHFSFIQNVQLEWPSCVHVCVIFNRTIDLRCKRVCIARINNNNRCLESHFCYVLSIFIRGLTLERGYSIIGIQQRRIEMNN